MAMMWVDVCYRQPVMTGPFIYSTAWTESVVPQGSICGMYLDYIYRLPFSSICITCLSLMTGLECHQLSYTECRQNEINADWPILGEASVLLLGYFY